MMRSIKTDRGTTNGVSIAEMLVVLAALALISAVLASGVRPPSDRLDAQHQEALLANQLAQLRFEAVETSQVIHVEFFGEACPEGQTDLTLHPDGTANGGPYCLNGSEAPKVIRIDPLTARILPEVDE